MDSVYFTARKHWALDSVSDIINLVSQHQCPAVINFSKHNTLTNTSSTPVTDVLTSIRSYFETSLVDQINKAKYIAVLADESTDQANQIVWCPNSLSVM